MKKLCYVATIPAVVHAFLRGHIQAAAEKYQVTVICNSVDKELLAGLNARLIFLPIERKPSPWKDILIFFRLLQLFRLERFEVVHSIMPKTGMLAMLTARLANVPVCIHTFTGQVWVTRHGFRRIFLMQFDKLIGIFATCVLADSPSQRDFLIREGVLAPDKAMVIGMGSVCGVDPARFHADTQAAKAVRSELGISQDARVILFVGRLNRDKGMLDLATAFNAIAKLHSDAVLLLVGAEEDVPFSRIQEICCAERDRLHYVNFTSVPERYMAAADIFCLPSYREGFGMTIIEAAACGVPTVASRIYGITDAMNNGETGLWFPVGNVAALAEALSKLIRDNALRQQMGNAARVRTLALFPAEKITRELLVLYARLSEEH